MSTWFTRNLGDAMLAGESLDRIRTLIQSSCESADKPDELAVFMRHESEGRLHCDVVVYFTPATVAVARAFGAVACVKPSPASLGLLAGSASSWPVFFPGRGVQVSNPC